MAVSKIKNVSQGAAVCGVRFYIGRYFYIPSFLDDARLKMPQKVSRIGPLCCNHGWMVKPWSELKGRDRVGWPRPLSRGLLIGVLAQDPYTNSRLVKRSARNTSTMDVKGLLSWLRTVKHIHWIIKKYNNNLICHDGLIYVEVICKTGDRIPLFQNQFAKKDMVKTIHIQATIFVFLF